MAAALHRRTLPIVVIAGMTLAGAIAAPAALADTPAMALALRVGTIGVGLDYDIALSRWFSARVGYSGIDITHSIDTSDVDYHGTLKLSMPNAVLDWHVFGGGFRVSLGAVGNGTKLDVTGQPAANGSFTLNGHVYTAGDVGLLSGQLKFGNSVSPYVGLGWGNPVGSGHWHFLADIGAIYGGTPNVSLVGMCGTADPPGSTTCNQLQADVQTEKLKLQDTSLIKWYPVLDIGAAYRF